MATMDMTRAIVAGIVLSLVVGFVVLIALSTAFDWAARAQARMDERKARASGVPPKRATRRPSRGCVYLAVAGGAIAWISLWVALILARTAQDKHLPPSLQEGVAWGAFFAGLLLCVPLLISRWIAANRKLMDLATHKESRDR